MDRSLHGDWLRYADRAWVQTIERGLLWTWRGVLVSLIGILAMILFVVIVAAAGAMTSGRPLPSWVETGFVVVVGLMWLAGCAGLVIGLWMVSTPEPRVAATEPLRPIMLRAFTLAMVPVIAVWIGSGAARAASANIPPWAALLMTLASIAVVGGQTWLLVSHLKALERRCYGFEDQRNRLLGKYQRQVIGVSASVTILAFGTYFLLGGTLGTGLVIVAWVAVLGLTRETHRRIRFELAIPASPEVDPSA